MNVIPIATNHIAVELDNGEVLDINDGSKVDNAVTIRLESPTQRRMVVCTSITYDASVRLLLDK